LEYKEVRVIPFDGIPDRDIGPPEGEPTFRCDECGKHFTSGTVFTKTGDYEKCVYHEDAEGV
jgi:hypothetical protein